MRIFSIFIVLRQVACRRAAMHRFSVVCRRMEKIRAIFDEVEIYNTKEKAVETIAKIATDS